METKEITAGDRDHLERLVKFEEENGWTRQGEVEIVHPHEPGPDRKVGNMSYLQTMTRETLPPQD